MNNPEIFRKRSHYSFLAEHSPVFLFKGETLTWDQIQFTAPKDAFYKFINGEFIEVKENPKTA